MDKLNAQAILHFLKHEIVRHDPVGLIDGGAPEDEYDTEIGKLISHLLKTEKSEQKYYEVIHDVFSELGEVKEDICRVLAKNILKEL
ncbi:TPA: hypothetical protein DDZ10_01495 [Candidatus Uhrbacteria bacterium]|nr:MAG: hypothetical protein UY79_C0004G0006 [Parcubacteria group bacterium GW2011_GWA2_53_21]OGL72080.1 MAG: hypothetical protein A3D69_03555 [Candidatus Uhrbacteria bacterium RIFCSPHIGHO2_02_FULL_54_11]HBL39325.1 hypothetical protein [Candidatus Uhrbacteria bacterium]